MDEEIREGFLCPICFKDLKSPTNLASHFEDFHDEDKDVLQQLRTVFGKAKRKILNISNEDDNVDGEDKATGSSNDNFNISHGTPVTGGIDLALWEPQGAGVIESHTKIFRQRRKETIERFVVETNKLIIRLDKLVKSGIYASDSPLPGAVKTRKNVEKSVVPWQNDNDVKFCPSCQKKFTVTYRRHHCRLCGKVICQNCIDFMDMTIACSVLKLDKLAASSYVKLNKEPNSDADNGLKACTLCQDMLKRQNKLYQDKSANNTLILLYDKMKASIREADKIQPKFLKMADSVNAGETEYGLEITTETRYKLLKNFESVEALSKRIQHLGIGSEKEPGPKILKLQRSIRIFASNYLADNMFTLPGLPSQDKYNSMLKEREQQRDRLKKEKTLSLKTAYPGSRSRSSSPVTTATLPASLLSNTERANSISSTRAGTLEHEGNFNHPNNNNGFLRTSTSKFKAWKKEVLPVQVTSVSKEKNSSWGPIQVDIKESSDPIIQQIAIIESYIKQAREAERWEEVHVFEQNLKDLKHAYDAEHGKTE